MLPDLLQSLRGEKLLGAVSQSAPQEELRDRNNDKG